MTIVRRDNNMVIAFIKGAPDIFLEDCVWIEDRDGTRKLEDKDKKEILAMVAQNIESAVKDFKQIEFSPEDASRTERDFLAQVVRTAIDAGATSINIPDTVGYAIPEEFSDLIRLLIKKSPELGKKVVLSVHCHNDLGLATANSLAAVIAGANQVECTVNGIGERGGNASLEEIAMTIDTRADFMNC